MTDAPDVIFAFTYEINEADDGAQEEKWVEYRTWEAENQYPITCTKYTRTDLVDAMIAEAEQRGREAEREECARVADLFQQRSGVIGAALDSNRAGRIAAAIRARGVKP